MRYAVVGEKGESNFSAYVPDLPGNVATGQTKNETENLIRDSIEFHRQGIREDGLHLLAPSGQVDYVDVSS